jgi:hypothetical protein
VLDANGKPHPVRTETSGDGTLQHVVDAGDVSLDLATSRRSSSKAKTTTSLRPGSSVWPA